MSDGVLQAAIVTLLSGIPRIAMTLKPTHLMGRPLGRPATGTDPVIIVHGVLDSEEGSQDLADSLRRDGFTVFTPTMPSSGMEGIAANEEFLRRYVAWVLRTTGARKVDMVGHSQGGLSIRAFIRAGGARVVDSAVSIASPHHGVNGIWQSIADVVRAVPLLDRIAPRGLMELLATDPVYAWLNSGDETPFGEGEVADGVRYTSIYSRDSDGVVFPASSPHLDGARNVVLEDERWFGLLRGPHHILMNHYSDAAFDAVRGALLAARAAPLTLAGRRSRIRHRPDRTSEK